MTHFVVSGQGHRKVKYNKYNKWDCIEIFSTIIDIPNIVLLHDISTSMYIYVNDCGRGLCSSICSVFYLPILQDTNHFIMGAPEKPVINLSVNIVKKKYTGLQRNFLYNY
jgi:hypothetical protein